MWKKEVVWVRLDGVMLEKADSMRREVFSGRVDNGENVVVMREGVNGGRDDEDEERDM